MSELRRPGYTLPRPIQARRLPSRYRIAQLESEVARLRDAVRGIQQNLGYRAAEISNPAVAEPVSTSSAETRDSDDDSSISDVLAAEQPSHLRSLFDNDWLSVDAREEEDQLTNSKAKAYAHIVGIARQALQRLIPPIDEAEEFIRSGSRWLVLVQTLLPLPFAVKSQQEMMERYSLMHEPDVDAIDLASWLLDFAVMAHQNGPERTSRSPVNTLREGQRVPSFSRAVSDTVETTILSHHRLTGTIQGLGMAIRFLRLQLSQLKFEKVWLRLRQIIGIAELVGVPKAARAAQRNKAGTAANSSQLQSAQLWEVICSADRLLSMLLSLPPGTKRFQHTASEALTLDGVVQPHAYLAKLTDIACRLQCLDDMSTTDGSLAEVYASALEFDRELRALASHTPKLWWNEDSENVKPDHVVQILHYYIVMRVHLPFTMRGHPDDEYIFSRLACLDACEAVARRYQSLRRALPSGMFLARILDLVAFTATVVLLLTAHSWPSTSLLNMQTNKARIETRVMEVINLLEEKSCDSPGSGFVQHGLFTLRSLYALLQQGWQGSDIQQLNLKVPLLGIVHVRRHERGKQALQARDPHARQHPMGPGQPSAMLMQQPNAQAIGTTSTDLGPAWAPETGWQQNPFSWSIEEDPENCFQDPFTAEAFDQFPIWQTDTNPFPLE